MPQKVGSHIICSSVVGPSYTHAQQVDGQSPYAKKVRSQTHKTSRRLNKRKSGEGCVKDLARFPMDLANNKSKSKFEIILQNAKCRTSLIPFSRSTASRVIDHSRYAQKPRKCNETTSTSMKANHMSSSHYNDYSIVASTNSALDTGDIQQKLHHRSVIVQDYR